LYIIELYSNFEKTVCVLSHVTPDRSCVWTLWLVFVKSDFAWERIS